MKKLVLGNLFKLFRLAVTLAWEVCDTSQLIWIVQMMRLKGGKWASLVKQTWVLATWNLILPLWWTSILLDRGRLDRAGLPYDAIHGSPHGLPKENYLTQLFLARVNNRCQHAGVKKCATLGTKSILQVIDGRQEEKNWDKECDLYETILAGYVIRNYSSAFRLDIFIKHHIFHEFV